MDGPYCGNCGLTDSALVILKGQTHHKKGIYLCGDCHDEYKHNHLVLAYCDSCEIEFFTEDEGSSTYTCKSCQVYTKPHVLTLEDVYPDIRKKRNPAMCLQKALRLYLDDRKNEPRETVRNRAMTFFKIMKGLPDHAVTIGQMASTAKRLGLKYFEYFNTLADYDRSEEGLDELIAVMKEQGYKTYQAALEDEQEVGLGYEPRRLKDYIISNPPPICLQEHDPFADIPF